MSEPIEVQLARMDERMKSILQAQQANSEAQAAQFRQLHALDNTMHSLKERVSDMEESIANAGPALAEYTMIKHKVIGAGLAGKWIWVAASFVLGAIASSKGAILSWFSHGAG